MTACKSIYRLTFLFPHSSIQCPFDQYWFLRDIHWPFLITRPTTRMQKPSHAANGQSPIFCSETVKLKSDSTLLPNERTPVRLCLSAPRRNFLSEHLRARPKRFCLSSKSPTAIITLSGGRGAPFLRQQRPHNSRNKAAYYKTGTSLLVSIRRGRPSPLALFGAEVSWRLRRARGGSGGRSLFDGTPRSAAASLKTPMIPTSPLLHAESRGTCARFLSSLRQLHYYSRDCRRPPLLSGALFLKVWYLLFVGLQHVWRHRLSASYFPIPILSTSI